MPSYLIYNKEKNYVDERVQSKEADKQIKRSCGQIYTLYVF